MIDNPRFRGMTLPQAREIVQKSEGFRDLSDREVWALRMVHAHDCTQRPAEPDQEAPSALYLARRAQAKARDVRDGEIEIDGLIRTLDALAGRLSAERPADPERGDMWTRRPAPSGHPRPGKGPYRGVDREN